MENRFKFTGQELDHHEFSDGAGLDWYEFRFRRMDPQIGRFIQADPLANKYPYNSLYAYAENRVIDGIDLEGTEYLRFSKFQYAGNGWDYAKTIPNALIDIGQAAVDMTWNSGVSNYQSLRKGSWTQDLTNEVKGYPGAIKNYVTNSYN